MREIQIQAFLADYTEVVSGIETAFIDVINPCLSPIWISIPKQISQLTYYYSGDSPALSFQPEGVTVSPFICSFEYKCEIISGPRADLCNVVDGSTVGQFSVINGRFDFQSTSMQEFSSGTYTMQITVQSIASAEQFTIEILLESPCLAAEILMLPTPFIDQIYVLGDAPTWQPWNSDQLVNVESPIECGPVSVEIYDAANDGAINESLFFDDRAEEPSNFFRTVFTEDQSMIGIYEFYYRVSLVDFPDNYSTSRDSFKIEIVNPCDSPRLFIASVLEDQEYTLADGP